MSKEIDHTDHPYQQVDSFARHFRTHKKRYCVDKAIACGAGPADIIKVAREIEAFMEAAAADQGGKTALAGTPDAPEKQAQAPVVRAWAVPSLTPTEKIVLRQCITWHNAGEKISGVRLNQHLKTQGNSTHLRKLVRKKYMERLGNKFWPVRTPQGAELPPVLTKCPPAAAKGYKPLTQKLGNIARTPS